MQSASDDIQPRARRRLTLRDLFSRTSPELTTLNEDVEAESVQLDRDILNRELAAITERHRIAGLKARKDYLVKWLQRPTDAQS